MKLIDSISDLQKRNMFNLEKDSIEHKLLLQILINDIKLAYNNNIINDDQYNNLENEINKLSNYNSSKSS